MLVISTFDSPCRDHLLFICVSRLFILAFKYITSLFRYTNSHKTLTNWNIIIVDNCSNVGCDKITTAVNHTRYNVLLYN